MCHPNVLAIIILQKNPQIRPVITRDLSSLPGFPKSGYGEHYGYLDLSYCTA